MGPELPWNFDRHCMAKINDSHVILTGGWYNGTETLLVDTKSDFEMKPGPSMTNKRGDHTCGIFTDQGNGYDWVIVAGGFGEDYLSSIELWDPISNDGWIEGSG